MRREYWDTCLFLAYLNNEKDTADVVAALLQEAARPKSEILIVVSTFVMAEIRPRSSYDPIRAKVVWDLFRTNRSYIRVVTVTPVIADVASRLGGDHNAITSPDATHVATALVEGVDVMLTLDGPKSKEARRSGKLLSYNGLEFPPYATLKIEAPQMPSGAQMSFPVAIPLELMEPLVPESGTAPEDEEQTQVAATIAEQPTSDQAKQDDPTVIPDKVKADKVAEDGKEPVAVAVANLTAEEDLYPPLEGPDETPLLLLAPPTAKNEPKEDQ